MLLLSGPRTALLSLLLLSTFPLLYGNGKNVLGEVPGMLYVFCALIFLWRIEANNFRGEWNYLFLGLATALAAATKPIFFLLPVAVALGVLLSLRSLSFHSRGVAWGALGFFMPLALWFALQFGVNDQVGAVLSHYANPYSVFLFSTVKENILRFFREATP